MSDAKQTKITISEDRATGIATVMNGANLNGLAFNIEFISGRDVHLASDLIKLYEEAKKLESKTVTFNETA